MVKETNKVRSKKCQSIFQLLLIIGLVVLLNLVLNQYFFRIDLTKEKRFSLGEASKNLAKKVTNLYCGAANALLQTTTLK